MERKNWILLLVGGGAAALLYQRSVKAKEQAKIRAAQMAEQTRRYNEQFAAAQAKAAKTAVITEGGTLAPPPEAIRTTSTKYGPAMVP